MDYKSFIDLSASAPDENEGERPRERRRKRKRNHAIDLTQSQTEETIEIDEPSSMAATCMGRCGEPENKPEEDLTGVVHGVVHESPLRRFKPPSRPPYQNFLHNNILSSNIQQPSSSSRPSEIKSPHQPKTDPHRPSASFAFLNSNLNPSKPNGASSSRRDPPPPPPPPSSDADEQFAKRMQEEEDAAVAASLARSFDSEDNRRMRERMELLEAMESIDEEEAGPMMLQLSERAQALLEAGRRRGINREEREERGSRGDRFSQPSSDFASRFFSSIMEGMHGSFEGFEDGSRRARRRDRGEDRGRGRPRGGRGGASFGQMAQLAASGIPPSLLYSNRDFTPEDYEMLQRLDSTVENRNGASFEEIHQLPTVAASAGGVGGGVGGSEMRCCICLDEIAPGSNLRILPCLHKEFHQTCVDKWLVEKSVCPVCQCSVKV